MSVEYVLMMDLQKWYCMNHQQSMVHVIRFALIVSNAMPRYLSRWGSPDRELIKDGLWENPGTVRVRESLYKGAKTKL